MDDELRANIKNHSREDLRYASSNIEYCTLFHKVNRIISFKGGDSNSIPLGEYCSLLCSQLPLLLHAFWFFINISNTWLRKELHCGL